VHDGVDDRFASCDRRHARVIAAPKTRDLHPVHGMFSTNAMASSKRADRICSDLGAIEDATPVDALEATDLDPGIGKVLVARLAEQQQPTDRGNSATLGTGHEAQRLQIRPAKAPNRREQL
jgi:hypothetical protein